MTDFNGFKGRAKRLDDIDLPRLGHQIGVGEDELHAFMDVETSGSGFDSQGRPKILFEPHVFYRNLSGSKRTQAVKAKLAAPKWGEIPYGKTSNQYPRLIKAMAIDETAALKSASWGLGQILGENHAMVGYSSVQAMVKAFMDDEENHLQAIIDFLVASGIDDDLREHRWDVVARVYNGPGYKKNKYDTKMAAAYAKWAKIPDTPWSPEDDAACAPVNPPVPSIAEETFGDHLYNGLRWPIIEKVQEQLDCLGYPEVGAFDGRWGSKTRAAVLAFRADNGLPITPTIDEDLLAALLLAKPRPVSPERQQATVSDLRKEGAEDVAAADVQQVAGGVAAAGGAVVGVGKLLDQVEEYSGLLHRIAAIVNPIQEFLQDNIWLLLLGVGGIVVWQSGVLKNIRLRKHQTGMDVSE